MAAVHFCQYSDTYTILGVHAAVHYIPLGIVCVCVCVLQSAERDRLCAAHDRRLQRMRTLQANHRLLEEQLRTFEAKE